MTATFTSRLGLRKPDPDPVTGDDVNVQTDLNDNWDKLDLIAGFTVCTSATRPTTPFDGQGIVETDTGKAYVRRGASWVQLLLGTALYDASAYMNALGVGATVGFPGAAEKLKVEGPAGGSVATFALRTTGSASFNRAFGLRSTSDAEDRLTIDYDGKIQAGSGLVTPDCNLYRSAADTWKTDDSFDVAGTLRVGSSPKIVTAQQNGVSAACIVGSTASASFATIPGSVGQFIINKSYASTRMRIGIMNSLYCDAQGAGVELGLRIGGTDYAITKFFFNQANVHTQVSGFAYISGVAAGTNITCTPIWRNSTGFSTLRTDTNDWVCVEAIEVA